MLGDDAFTFCVVFHVITHRNVIIITIQKQLIIHHKRKKNTIETWETQQDKQISKRSDSPNLEIAVQAE